MWRFDSEILGITCAAHLKADSNAVGGRISRASLRDGDGNEVLACDVTLIGGGGMIELSNLVVAPTQEVQIVSLSYTAAP